MITLGKTPDMTTLQLKGINFALAHLLRKSKNEFEGLYQLAKSNLGCKSLVFGLNKHQSKIRKCRGEDYVYGTGLLQSLENKHGMLTWQTRLYVRDVNQFINDQLVEGQLQDIKTDMKFAAAAYDGNVKHIAAKFWDEEAQDILLILADALEDIGAMFEADHLRVGQHSPACPVILKIMKGVQ